MKVVTPMIKPKSVSQQIKQQMTPVATPEPGRKDSLKGEDSPKPIMKMSKISDSSLGEPGDRETVIGGNTLPRPKGSPAPPRISRTGWDSSQEDISSRSQTLGRTAKQNPISQVAAFSNQTDSGATVGYDLGVRSNSITLPPPDYPRAKNNISLKDKGESLPQSDAMEEEEEESMFAKALRERKNELAKRSAEKLRLRANTMPEKNSSLIFKKSVNEISSRNRTLEHTQETVVETPPALEQEEEEEPEAALSPLQMELLKANKKRSERLEMNKPRITKSKTIDSDEREKPSVSNNPLAKAISQRINSLNVGKINDWDEDDFESSPGPSPVQSPKKFGNERTTSKPPKTKLPPPTVRPKPTKKAGAKAEAELGNRSESPVNVSSDGEQSSGSLPFKVNLKSKAERERLTAGAANTRRSESPVNVPANGVEDGSASPLPFKFNLRSRASSSGKKEEKRKKDGDDDNDSFTMNWKSVLKPSSGSGSGRASPVVTNSKSSPKPAVLESITTPDSGQAGSETQFSFEAIPPDHEFALPPPLQADDDNRISFIDLEPPEAFYVEGVDSTADSGVAGDLPAFMSPTISEGSSIPPPIPNSSPPVMVTESPPMAPESPPSAFVFPDYGGDVTFPDVDIPMPKPMTPVGSVDLPSPLPSPTSRGSSRMDEPLSAIPPPMFGDDSIPSDIPPPQPLDGGSFSNIEQMFSDSLPPEADTSVSKVSVDSDISDTPPPPPPSEPPPFLDINESVDIIDASIKSLEELDGLFVQDTMKEEPATLGPMPVMQEKAKAEPVKTEPAKAETAKEEAYPPKVEHSESERKLKQKQDLQREPAMREPTIGSTEVTVPAPAAESAISPATTPKEAPAVANKQPPPTVLKKPVKASPPEHMHGSIESRYIHIYLELIYGYV